MSGQTQNLIDEIFRRIDFGRLNPGDVIDEQELVDAFNVSRTPVREALLHLEAVGLIRRLPRKGATLFRPTLEEFLAILEIHSKLEGQAAGLAVQFAKSGVAHHPGKGDSAVACGPGQIALVDQPARWSSPDKPGIFRQMWAG